MRPFYLVYNQSKRFSPLQLRLLEFLRTPSESAEKLVKEPRVLRRI